MSSAARNPISNRGITRLCHFTQSRNLPHILKEGRLLSVRDLQSRNLPVNPTDDDRLDGYDDHISCSIEYPNTWYLEVVRRRELLFEDWVVLELAPDSLWADSTAYCPVNAATGRGRYIARGSAALESMYDVSPKGSKQNRGMLHLEACPTDDQAEALIAEPIETSMIRAIITISEDQARKERFRLLHIKSAVDGIVWKAAPMLFSARKLSGAIRSGERPPETVVGFP